MKQRPSTTEEYRKQINIVVEYIGSHLAEPIDLARLAEISHFSPCHFHRITRALLGEPIGAYIVRVRLETAAKLLRYTDLPVADVAYRVGYDVPSSLSKAFKQQYGISPIDYRNDKEYFIMKPSLKQTQLNIKGPKIMNLPAKKAIYINMSGSYDSLDFGGTWERLWAFVKQNKLFSPGIEHLAVYHDDPKVTSADKLRTDLCLTVKKDVKPQGEVGVKEIQGGKYAMFLYRGPYDNLDSVYDAIYSTLPQNNLRIKDCPGFEKYLNHPGRTKPEKLKTEIYVPVE